MRPALRTAALAFLLLALDLHAEAPDVAQMARVNVRTSQLETATRTVLQTLRAQMKKRAKKPEKQALVLLEELALRIQRFQEVAQAEFHRPANTEEAFREMAEAYLAAVEALPALERHPDVLVGFEPIRAGMDELAPLYGGFPGQLATALPTPVGP